MDILLDNLSWMTFNEILAVLPVLFIWFCIRAKNKVVKFVFGVLWLLFLPNSIYIITDIEHLIRQWPQVAMSSKLILILQYGILEAIGLVAFFLSLHPLEELLKRWQYTKTSALQLLIGFNFLMGFAMVLGKVERIHSWYVFTEPMRVVTSVWHLLSSVELVGLALLLGMFTNCLYFLFKEPLLKRLHQR